MRHIRSHQPRLAALTILILVALGLSLVAPPPAQTSTAVGHRSHSHAGFGATDVGGAITGQKPESKLWYHDGAWWATMLSPTAKGAHTIHKLNGTTWSDTGVVTDTRPAVKEDVLSTGSKLYVLSRGNGTTGPSRLNRFSYQGGTYTRDSGFPVDVPGHVGETNTLARDSTGTLWITYDHQGSIYVARSMGNDATWGKPFVLPFKQATDATNDDISAVIAFQDASGPAIGVMWSNQNRERKYFAIHRDGAPDGEWTNETALSGPKEADDHINLKTFEGRVYAVVKTSATSASAPLIRLLVRSPSGSWSKHPVAKVDKDNTRPITMLEIDPAARQVYVFMTKGTSSRVRGIQYKRTSIDGIGFPDKPTWFIRGPNDERINDPTSMKANATAASGIVVLASDSSHYWWNRIGGSGGGTAPPPEPEPEPSPSPEPDPTPAPEPVGDTRATWWMDEGGGDVIHDASGHDHHGALSGNTKWITGVRGQALRLNGKDAYATVRDSAPLRLGQQFTIATWIRPEATGTQYLIKKGNHSGADGFELSLASGGTAFVRLNQIASGNTFRIDSTSKYPTDGRWMHLAATFDGTTMRLYVNGVQEGSKPGPSAGVGANQLDLLIGAELDNAGAPRRFYRGALDEVHIYDTALTAEQVAALR